MLLCVVRYVLIAMACLCDVLFVCLLSVNGCMVFVGVDVCGCLLFCRVYLLTVVCCVLCVVAWCLLVGACFSPPVIAFFCPVFGALFVAVLLAVCCLLHVA